ncbi:MAG: ABC transporter substrate-binding protein [Mesorhizobium sp.]|nr:ABC transporter substrate-binding protein [bacterium M00.F.Ca.ET.205.01.1.1]TGU50613.1 ABC transporter substrate-binding protein [bacterium M00.F.Ca.ET.152.01.1.1]TGV34071.1 ABC transporter substrate-binding protein [Mesorhizobium sp. M00.F.Ca.ET.186.01.1.1]TGZ40977.1 ABC transporter substrate-binding protein [bacterium M00.F.Ca.ET.162.01.1.1]TJW32011.1 MAG: ABC transporter substrate-binding protein [Mesorhizobium sp.]
MEFGRRVPCLRMWAVALVLAGSLLGCQSKGGVSEVLEPAAIDPGNQPAASAVASPSQASQSLGTGPTKVAVLLPLSAPGAAGETGRKMLDAAKLAMTDLGNPLLTLTVEDTRGDVGYSQQLAIKAITSGAKVVIGPAELPAAQHVAKLSGSNRPPVLALADNFAGGPGVYAVCLSEADSAAAGAGAIAAKGGKKFVLLVPAGGNADAVEHRVANSLSVYGANIAVTIPYSAADGGAKAVADMGSLVDAPDAVIVASGDGSPTPMLIALKSKGIPGKATSVVGTNRWLDHPIDPLFEGAYIATLDPRETGPIAARFKTTFNYQPDVNVAYAYDMVALTAGVASALGPDSFNRKVFENPSGFRGSTGLFRFRADGSSERSMPLYRIEKGALKLVAKSTSGF